MLTAYCHVLLPLRLCAYSHLGEMARGTRVGPTEEETPVGSFPAGNPGQTWADAVRARGEWKRGEPWFPLRVAA